MEVLRLKASVAITTGVMDPCVSFKQQSGALPVKDSRKKKKGGINAPLETPVTSTYIRERRKKTAADLLKIRQTAFNHGAVWRPASREQRSGISSGARSPESRSSLALFRRQSAASSRKNSQRRTKKVLFSCTRPDAMIHTARTTNTSWPGGVNT